jgi:hypothetical protein
MRLSARYKRLIIAALAVLLLAGAGRFVWRSGYLKSRALQIRVGMPREQVEGILGAPYMVLDRVGGKGTSSVWIDDFWQVDVVADREGRVERVGCVPSNSLYRHTVGRLTGFPK